MQTEIKDLFIKLFFVGDDWHVAWRGGRKQWDDTALVHGSSFHTVVVPTPYWIADPFLFSCQGQIYLFAEAYDKEKHIGRIASMKYYGTDFTDFSIIIQEPYHMSYPFVFQVENEILMIPETGDNRTVDLYRVEDMPTKWVKQETILNGRKFVDTNLVFDDNGQPCALITYDDEKRELLVYRYALHKTPELIDCIYDKNKVLRGAGNVFRDGKKLIRPSQCGRVLYGKSIFFSNIGIKSNSFFSHPICKLEARSLPVEGGGEIGKVHTYSSAGNLEVVDYAKLKPELLKPAKKFQKKLGSKLGWKGRI